LSIPFPNAVGTEADLATFRTLYQQSLDADSRGLFTKGKSYANACMAMILSKRITFKKEAA
jgi:hypothetical protein